MTKKRLRIKIHISLLFSIVLLMGAVKFCLWKHYQQIMNKPEQFAIVDGIPFAIHEGNVYEYKESGNWEPLSLTGEAKQLVCGETLCILHTDGSLYYEGTLTTEDSDSSNGSAYNLYMANLALALNKEEPFACINQNVEYYDFRALLPDGDILYQTIDEYAHYKMTDETPIYLSGDYILTEQGNVYLLDIDNMNDKTTISLTCMYDKEDIIAIDCCETASRCLALTEDGNVISFSDLAPLNTSNWKDVIAVAQGFSYAVGLTDKGKVLYVDYDAENTKAVSKELASWKNVVQIAVYYDTIVGLKEDGSLFFKKLINYK